MFDTPVHRIRAGRRIVKRLIGIPPNGGTLRRCVKRLSCCDGWTANGGHEYKKPRRALRQQTFNSRSTTITPFRRILGTAVTSRVGVAQICRPEGENSLVWPFEIVDPKRMLTRRCPSERRPTAAPLKEGRYSPILYGLQLKLHDFCFPKGPHP
jgi:hypothetical protein